MTLPQIIEKMTTGQMTPSEASQYRLQISADIYKFSEQETDLILKSVAYFVEERPNHKSDTATQRAWNATKDGMQELKIHSLVRTLGTINTALKDLVYVKTLEAKNIL